MAYKHHLKPAFDRVVSIICLVALSPVFSSVWLAVRLRIGKPVLFRQDRPGLNGEVFRLVKFRTMTNERGPDGNLLPDEQRLTRLGAALRRSSLDELPELINVARGEMSLVGPRPLLVEYLPRYSPSEFRRHEVRPGITGLAQVTGRNSLSWSEQFERDVEYVETVSFALDLKILARTVTRVIFSSSAEAGSSTIKPDFMGNEATNEKDPLK